MRTGAYENKERNLTVKVCNGKKYIEFQDLGLEIRRIKILMFTYIVSDIMVNILYTQNVIFTKTLLNKLDSTVIFKSKL